MKKIRKAVIPAAGLGTRVLPATKAMPKEMLPIVDKPAIQYIVEEAAASGIEDILIITNRGKGLLEDHFDRAPELEERLTGNPQKEAVLKEVVALSKLANIYYVRQKETKGLGHAVNCARSFVQGEPFAVLYGGCHPQVFLLKSRAPAGQLLPLHGHGGEARPRGGVLPLLHPGPLRAAAGDFRHPGPHAPRGRRVWAAR